MTFYKFKERQKIYNQAYRMIDIVMLICILLGLIVSCNEEKEAEIPVKYETGVVTNV